jgi:hypothetical protein
MDTVQTRSFRIEGTKGLGAKPIPELIGPVLTNVHSFLQDSVRMRFLRSSHAPGRIPKDLKDAAAVRFVRHDGAGTKVTVLYFEVPSLGDTAEDFLQSRLWEDAERPDPNHTSIDLFGEALKDVAAKLEDSNKYDVPLLNAISKSFRSMRKSGIERIAIGGNASEPALINDHVIHAASELAKVTPAARRVRVTGRLDVMGASQGILKLRVRPGESVTALWNEPEPIETHRELFNKDVVVEGMAVFRPSGRILRIDAKTVAPAVVQDDFFRQLPEAYAGAPSGFEPVARSTTAKSPFARLLGAIPAEESDEDFQAALESLR